MSEIPSEQTPAARPGAKIWTVGTLIYTSGSLTILFCWLLMGDFAWSMRERSVGPMSSWYLTQLGVPNLLFGLLISAFPAVLGMVVGPIVSVKSDRHRGPRGRRIPYLLLTTPIGTLGMLGIAFTPIIAHGLHDLFDPAGGFGGWLQHLLGGTVPGQWILSHLQSERSVAVTCFGIFWAIFEFAWVVSIAIFGGLVNDVVPKPVVGRFYGLFRAIHLIDGVIFNYWIMGRVPEHFTLILSCIAVLYGVAFMWMCYRVKEGAYPPPPEKPAVPDGRSRFAGYWAETKSYCRECFSNSYYVGIFVLVMISTVVFMPINVYAVPYAKSLGVSMDTYGKVLSLTFLISFMLSFFLGWLCDLFHPLRMVIASLLGYVIVTTWGSIYAKTPETFLIAWLLHGVLSGCYYTTIASLGVRLYPHSKFAQYASAAVNLASVATIVVVPLIGQWIDATDRNYQLTFACGCGLAVMSLISGFYVHRRFMKLGGPKNYVAP